MLNWLKYVLMVIPMVPTFIRGVETLAGHAVAAGQPKPTGEDKKQAVLQLAGAALGTVEEVAPHSQHVITAITPGLSSIIDGTVAIFNATGVFKTSTPAPAPVTTVGL